jgi:SagB-type dehydrogenase family enzyme
LRLGRREFLRLATWTALVRPAAAAAGDAPGAYAVHHATRNTWRGPLAVGQLVTERPLPYKPYAGAPRVALPAGAKPAPLSLAEALRSYAPAAAFAGEPISLGQLATLLALANGVTGEIPGRDPPVYRRAAPSAGALYAGEVYVVAERVSGLAPGVYYYAVEESALVALASESESALGAVARAVETPGAISGAAFALLLTNVFERYAWRYGARGYRYALIDSGHIGENLRLAATAAGLAHASWLRFEDDALAALLGIDGRREAVCALHAVGRRGEARGGAARRGLVERGGAETSLSEVERYHEATKLVPGSAARTGSLAGDESPSAGEAVRLAEAPPPGLAVAQAIRQRRSARGFREEPIAQQDLGLVLEHAKAPGVALRLVVHRVDGLEPGLYAAGAEARALVKLRGGSLARRLVRTCLFQEMAGTAAAAFVFVARFESDAGARDYRDQLLRAGAAAQRVYLAAESLGLAARNLAAFTDDALNALLGLDGRGHAVVHLTMVGRES